MHWNLLLRTPEGVCVVFVHPLELRRPYAPEGVSRLDACVYNTSGVDANKIEASLCRGYMTSEPVVGDMSITDEHAVVGAKATFADVCQPFLRSRDAAVLVENAKTGEIDGVITLKDLLEVIATGKNPAKEKISKHMRTKVVEMPIATPLSGALRMMAESQPDAVVIRGPNGEFAGYFSPDDYREASRRLESHQMLSMRMQRSKSALGDARDVDIEEDDPAAEQQALLDVMLGDFEDEEEDEDPGAGIGH